MSWARLAVVTLCVLTASAPAAAALDVAQAAGAVRAMRVISGLPTQADDAARVFGTAIPAQTLATWNQRTAGWTLPAGTAQARADELLASIRDAGALDQGVVLVGHSDDAGRFVLAGTDGSTVAIPHAELFEAAGSVHRLQLLSCGSVSVCGQHLDVNDAVRIAQDLEDAAATSAADELVEVYRRRCQLGSLVGAGAGAAGGGLAGLPLVDHRGVEIAAGAGSGAGAVGLLAGSCRDTIRVRYADDALRRVLDDQPDLDVASLVRRLEDAQSRPPPTAQLVLGGLAVAGGAFWLLRR